MKNKILMTFLVLASLCCCKTKNELSSSDTTAAMSIEKARSIFTNKVTITGVEGINPIAIEKRHKAYDLKYRGMSSKKENKLVYTFNDSLISSPDLVALLEKDKDIIAADPFRKSQTRVTVSKSGDKKKGVLTK